MAGAATFFLTQPSSRQSDITTEESSQNTAGPEILKGADSIEHLLALGKTVSCSFTYNSQNMGVGNGMGYFDQGRARVDASLNKSGKPFETHMIHDRSTLYTWTVSDEGNFAFMMPVQATETDGSAEKVDGARDALEEQVEYACDPWVVDEGKFTPPADVQFTDLSRIMETIPAPKELGDGAASSTADETLETIEIPEGAEALEGIDTEALEEMMQDLGVQ